MRTSIVVALLAVCLLGWAAAPADAQVGGPLCLQILEFTEVAEFFALPTGGGQLILTGKSITFGDAYTGSGYVDGGNFVFSVASGLLPGLLEGVINLATGQGSGSATFADTNEIALLSYKISSPPCVLIANNP